MTPTPLDPLTLPLRGRQVIEASAGTGKTWTLAAIYLRLVLGHGRQDAAPAGAEPDHPADAASGSLAAGLLPPQILVMTFTEAATAELRGRIRERLDQAAAFFRRGVQDAQAAQDSSTAGADAFLQALRAAHASALWPACAERLELAAQWMDDAAIFTIHGWSQRMLRQHAFDSASLFQLSRVEDGAGLRLRAVQDYWRQWFYPLSEAQLQALPAQTPEELFQKLGPLWAQAERAPAGATGPAAAAPDQLLRDWSCWHAQEQQLAQTVRAGWTPAVEALVQDAATRKLLKNYRANWLSGWLRHLREVLAGVEEKPVPDKLERLGLRQLVDSGWAEAQAHSAFADIEAWCAHRRAVPDTAQALLAHAAPAIEEAYRQAKARLAQFDFADLLQNLYHAVQAPDGRLARAIRLQYPVALVDEFQDTDPWQYGTLARIYAAADRTAGTLLMIGDPKQAIYSFRGADLGTYLQAREQAQAVHTLSGNFRSTAALVAAVNHVFTQAPQAFGDIPFVPVQACNPAVQALQRPGGTQAAMTVWHWPLDAAPRKAVFQRHMAAVCATQMVALLNEGAARPGDMAVLVRDRHEARAMRLALHARGVHSVFVSERDSVYASAEASDLWRILQAVAQPSSTALLRAALATRLWGLDWAQLEALAQNEAEWDALVEQCHAWKAIWQRQGVLPMLHHLLHAAGLPARCLAQRAGAGASGERRLTNVLHLGELLQQASQQLRGEDALLRHLEACIQRPQADSDGAQMRLESDAEQVQLVTLHKSKGLQYPLVFLPFASAFKADKSDSGLPVAERLAEDIRLLYVGLTRAQRALWLGLCNYRGDVDDKSSQPRSALAALLQRRASDDLGERLTLWRSCPQIQIAPAPEPGPKAYTPAPQTLQYKPARRPTRSLASAWWTASFSALTQHAAAHWDAAPGPGSDHEDKLADAQLDSQTGVAAQDGLPEAGPAGMRGAGPETLPAPGAAALRAAPGYNAFPAGSTYGSLLHDLLEWQAHRGWPLAQGAQAGASTDAPAAAEWQALLEQQARSLALAPEQARLLTPWVQQIVQTALPVWSTPPEATPALRLGALERADCWPEMGFTLCVQPTQAQRLDRLIQRHVWPGQPRPPLQPRQLEGMLVGFMDLVLLHQGRYAVLDYKSNRLASYDASALQAAMLAQRYDVQACLYLLALHRLLRSRRPDYDCTRHLGGALYLFLRGIDQPGAGLLSLAPTRALLDELDRELAGPPAAPMEPR